VLAETATVLNMSKNYPAYTYLLDSMGVDIEIPGGPEDGHYLPPWKEDINVDGSIDIFDISSIGIDWGRYCGSIRRNATTTTVGTAGWTSPTEAYTSNDVYTYTTTGGAAQIYHGYGFITTGWTGISKVEVGVEAKETAGGNNKIRIVVSKDAGSSWSTSYYDLVPTSSDALTWIDVTTWYAFATNPSWLSDTYFRVRMTYTTVGGGSGDEKISVDWIPVRVTPLPQTYSPYTDLNGDCIVDVSDLSMVAAKFGEQYAG